jgi:hypothetical protein
MQQIKSKHKRFQVFAYNPETKNNDMLLGDNKECFIKGLKKAEEILTSHYWCNIGNAPFREQNQYFKESVIVEGTLYIDYKGEKMFSEIGYHTYRNIGDLDEELAF